MTTCNVQIICTCFTVRISRALEVLEFLKVGHVTRKPYHGVSEVAGRLISRYDYRSKSFYFGLRNFAAY